MNKIIISDITPEDIDILTNHKKYYDYEEILDLHNHSISDIKKIILSFLFNDMPSIIFYNPAINIDNDNDAVDYYLILDEKYNYLLNHKLCMC